MLLDILSKQLWCRSGARHSHSLSFLGRRSHPRVGSFCSFKRFGDGHQKLGQRCSTPQNGRAMAGATFAAGAGGASFDPASYETPTSDNASSKCTNLGARDNRVALSEEEWRAMVPAKLTAQQYLVLRKKATEPGHRLRFPDGFDDFNDSGVYFCASCAAAGVDTPLYTSNMKFECGCGWPGFWTNVKDKVYEERDADGRRCEILCAACDGHLGHVFRGEGFGFVTDERHCVNSLSLIFQPAQGGKRIVPQWEGPVFG
eukprot:gnl/MRDRNA2_/MRDRNA2_31900_c0_seq1.p1 gnl/MRDRNA2_/MRDRNA2_31900_c0~~gnl/MRDRNA2_/MRDRNA2_31900_c0_seq1.p1  ORF type:complete len:279 (+),score=39.97 gnl/MRDRNA2_/MRDRNA2_31900_c0_seq1:65-838(+)